MSAAEAQELFNSRMTEKELDQNIDQLARPLGWVFTYHTWNSIHSQPGFPDKVMFHPGQKRIIFVELKRQKGERTSAQLAYGEMIFLCGGEYYLWRPSMWADGTIEKVLKGDK